MKSVFSVGLALPGNAAEFVPFRSDRALFDADIVIFTPTFGDYSEADEYLGCSRIEESDSTDLVQDCQHWRNELQAAVDAGKIVFIMLYKPVQVYYDTGQRSYSGTGRNRVTTRVVNSKNSYDAIPVSLKGLTPRGGSEIASLNLGPIAAYWAQFGRDSSYEVYFNYDEAGLVPLLATKNRERLVGALSRSKGGGAFVLLPPVQWDDGAFSYKRGKQDYWNKAGMAFGKRLVAALLDAAQTLQRAGARSPVPEWATAAEHATELEGKLQERLELIDAQTAALADSRRCVQTELEDAGVLRWLLYETGKPLESAILKALGLLGFVSEPFREGQSEFDAVFTAPEGRCLGEAEGKDNKAINVDKISQLARNLEEDYAREEVTSYAKGVLFGNAEGRSGLHSRFIYGRTLSLLVFRRELRPRLPRRHIRCRRGDRSFPGSAENARADERRVSKLSSQPLFQFNPTFGFVVAVLHDHRRVEREVPVVGFALAFFHGARARDDDGVLRDQ
jgi:hypothetical protein